MAEADRTSRPIPPGTRTWSKTVRPLHLHLYMLLTITLLAQCSHYLCPSTLACVHFPHHCPCAFPLVEDKVEIGEGIAVCASKGGFKAGEMARKVDLARKGLL